MFEYFNEQFTSFSKRVGFSIHQLIFLFYVFIKFVNDGKFLSRIKYLFINDFEEGDLKDFLNWIMEVVIYFWDYIVKRAITNPLGLVVIVFSFLAILTYGVKKRDVSDFIFSLYRLGRLVIRTFLFFVVYVWIYYIISLELQTIEYINFDLFNITMLFINALFILMVIISNVEYILKLKNE